MGSIPLFASVQLIFIEYNFLINKQIHHPCAKYCAWHWRYEEMVPIKEFIVQAR